MQLQQELVPFLLSLRGSVHLPWTQRGDLNRVEVEIGDLHHTLVIPRVLSCHSEVILICPLFVD